MDFKQFFKKQKPKPKRDDKQNSVLIEDDMSRSDIPQQTVPVSERSTAGEETGESGSTTGGEATTSVDFGAAVIDDPVGNRNLPDDGIPVFSGLRSRSGYEDFFTLARQA